jgi:hypothetical protein
MTPEQASTWCRDNSLQLRWSLFRGQHLVCISGLEVRSVIRRYPPNDPGKIEQILDEMVVEMEGYLGGHPGTIHSSFSGKRRE